MKKIIFSFMAIILALGVVSGSAYALFSSTPTISGLTFSTGNADLQIYNSDAWADNWDLGDSVFKNMYPSFTAHQQFRLKNNSISNIVLTLSAKLMDDSSMTEPSWAVLKDKIEIAFQAYDGSNWASSPLVAGYISLNQWNSSGSDLGTSLSPGVSNYYRMLIKVDDATSEELADKSISGLIFQFTGTQQ